MKRRASTPSAENIFYSDDRWIRLMNNHIYYRQFMDEILKNSKIGLPVCYQGNFLYADDGLDFSPLIDEETHDIVGGMQGLRASPPQVLYPTMAAYFAAHPTPPECCSIYFVGDVHAIAGGEYGVHWNFFAFVNFDNAKKFIYWFDPAVGQNTKGGYNFNSKKKHIVISELLKGQRDVTTLTDLAPDFPPQYVCNSRYTCVDSFCQTWVMLFAAAFVEGKVNSFFALPFRKYSNLILKTWLFCTVKAMPDWVKEFKMKELKNFGFCRLPPQREKISLEDVVVTKVKALKKEQGETCLDAVIRTFMN